MKTKIKTTIECLAAALILVTTGSPSQAADEQTAKKEEIRQIVVEARENAKEWAERIREYAGSEEKKTTYIGVVIESVPPVLRDYVDLPEGVGLLLPRIAKDGPADKAGLKDNDILVKFDGQLVINYSQFSTLVNMKAPGDTVTVTILRKGEEMDFDVTLEERVRKGMRFLHPDIPHAPDAPPVPDVGAIMEQVDEWIPGSVRVFIDENEQVHVDMEDLKNDLQGLRTKLQKIYILDDPDVDNIVLKHGDSGARTTTIHIADKDINFVSDDGRVEISNAGDQRFAKIMDGDGELLYEGPLPENYADTLPEEAVKLLEALEAIQLDTMEKHIEVELHTDEIDPVTMVISSS